MDSSPSVKASCEDEFENFEMHQLVELKAKFDGPPPKAFNPEELKDLLKQIFNVEYDNDCFNTLFLQMDSNCSGCVSWDELVTYLVLVCSQRDKAGAASAGGALELHPPVNKPPRILSSRHPYPITAIRFNKNIDKTDSSYPVNGQYITASPNGTVNIWSLNVAFKRSYILELDNSKGHTTVLSMECMPDVSILVISTSAKDLRFYDMIARQMTIRLVIDQWKNNVLALYYFSQESANAHHRGAEIQDNECILVAGDSAGSIYIFTFTSKFRGPFKNQPGMIVPIYSKNSVIKGLLMHMTLMEIPDVHQLSVRQVGYYSRLHSILSIGAETPGVICLHGAMTSISFKLAEGVLCIDWHVPCQLIAAGSPRGSVVIWSTFEAQTATRLGEHLRPVICVAFQSEGGALLSVDEGRVVKVWSLKEQTCIQTYYDIPSVVSSSSPPAILFNSLTRQLLLGSARLAVLECLPAPDAFHTDGHTHQREVTAVLCNKLFDLVITCGADSTIISWNILTGVKEMVIENAHTRVVNCQALKMEITAATLDPPQHHLITGARDGSLKIWNFITGQCLKSTIVDDMKEITFILWVEGRILVGGWGGVVTEFDENAIRSSCRGKIWQACHRSDITGAAACRSSTLATISRGGELVLWRLDTGRLIRQNSCEDPTARINIEYKRKYGAAQVDSFTKRSHRHMKLADFTRPDVYNAVGKVNVEGLSSLQRSVAAVNKESADDLYVMTKMKPEVAARAVIFLETRDIKANVANLMVSLSNGYIQAWSEHPRGGFLGAFLSCHSPHDHVISLNTDTNNQFLFTGSVLGYVAVWMMENYLSSKEVLVSMPQLRVQFPFIWRERFLGRAKRRLTSFSAPLLCSCHRAHLRSISQIAYLERKHFLLTASSDGSVRLWRLSGQYLQTLGTFLAWQLKPRQPPDVKRVASSTTIKVWNGGSVGMSSILPLKKQLKVEEQDEALLQELTEAERLPSEHLLSRICNLPARPLQGMPHIQLDDSMRCMPIFCHLRVSDDAATPRLQDSPGVQRKVRGHTLHKLSMGRHARFKALPDVA